MSHITEANIRAAAVEHIRRQLGQGKSLSKSLLACIDFKTGGLRTLSPSPLSSEETKQFDWGHTPTRAKPERIRIGNAYHLGVPTPTSDEQLVAIIYESLQSPESACLLENYLSEAHDPWLQRARSRVITNGSEVYHALFSVDRDKGKIDAAIREWRSLPTSVGALGVVNEEACARIRLRRAITLEHLAVFAASVQSVFIFAYDGEGYIVWKKASE